MRIVIIPAFKVEAHIGDVIRTIPGSVEKIIVVDDACPQQSGKKAEALGDPRVRVVYHEKNQGVGGAVVTGYQAAIESGTPGDVYIKMDGDGQMDPAHIDALAGPVERGEADYVKGNRFVDFKALRAMPRLRLFGNSVLSFMLKMSSGYWNIMDPTNGFTAISRDMASRLNLSKVAKRYFFESDMLIRLNVQNAVLLDVPIAARYGDEESSLSPMKVATRFPFQLFKGFIKRIMLKYFIYNFNMASIYMLSGIPMLLWGIGFGAYKWIDGYMMGYMNTTGTVMLSVLPLILGSQFLIAAINIDISSIPRKK